MTTAPTPAQPVSGQLLTIARDIKLSHTVFALPFALLAAFLAAGWADRTPRWDEFALILLCMVTARTFAMAVNRWADASIDSDNQRTAGRALPSGRVQRRTMLAVMLGCAVLFVGSAGGFYLVNDNPWPALLSLPVLFVLGGYSFTKRFTWLCHGVLGFALAISPVAAAIAIEPGYLALPVVWLLAGMVLCWVAGFDVLYALQDTEVDRQMGLHSIPSRLGVHRALWISRLLHAGSAGLLIGVAAISVHLRLLFAVAAGLAVCLLVIEHTLVWGGRTKQLNMAFFTINGVISILLGIAGIIDTINSA